LARRQAHREEKKSRIVEAAARVFARRGFFGTVMSEIAAEAAIGKGTLYEYFDSKEALFFAVFEWLAQKSFAQATVSVSALGGSASERLKALSDALMGLWVDQTDFFTLVMEFWSASASSQMRERFKSAFSQAYRDFRRLVGALIHEGMDRGEFRNGVDIESVAAALVGTWDALLLQAWFDEGFDPLVTARNFLGIVLEGLAPQESMTQQGF
jgi:AcrR family transcriptional regulator